MSERTTLIESRWASERWITELEESLTKEKICVAQQKGKFIQLS